jgi:hypothetical protein
MRILGNDPFGCIFFLCVLLIIILLWRQGNEHVHKGTRYVTLQYIHESIGQA